MIQNFDLRARVMARALVAGSAGLRAADIERELGFGARTTVGWMLAEGQLELIEPGRVRLAPVAWRGITISKKDATK